MILDKIEEQSCVVCAMENDNRERDGEDLGHDGGDEQGCRGGSPPAARPPRFSLASQVEVDR
eukprot:13907017-Heterocapsa_arctica.AAC.1